MEVNRAAELAANPQQVPADIREAFGLLRWMIHDLPDVLLEPTQELLQEFGQAVKAWRSEGGPEPDWSDWRSQGNELMEGEFPPLFPEDAG